MPPTLGSFKLKILLNDSIIASQDQHDEFILKNIEVTIP